MMSAAQTLSPVQELVANNTAHFPNESVVRERGSRQSARLSRQEILAAVLRAEI